MNDNTKPDAPLGKVYLPKEPGTPVGQFQFLMDRESARDIEIGTPIAADTLEGTVVGSLVDMRTVGTQNDPVGADFDDPYLPTPMAQRNEAQVGTAQMLYSAKMRSIRSGVVRAATPDEMLTATGYHSMEWPIPAGVVKMADGALAKVCLDGTSLLGPEAAHLMVGGLSGFASKTSFAITLLRSAIHAGSADKHSVGAIIFNLKGEDLIYLDEKPAADKELEDIDRQIYDALGTSPTPFDNVTVYAPALPGGAGTRSPRADAAQLRWTLPTVFEYLRYLFPWMNDDEKLASFFAQFRDELLNHYDPNQRVDSFRKLEQWFDNVLSEEMDEETGQVKVRGWRSHHPATLRRIRRMLEGLVARTGGLITQEGPDAERDIPVEGWMHSDVIVVDLAGLSADVKGLVIARTLERLLKSAEAGTLGVDHLACFVDELNEYAPAQGGEMAAVRKILKKISSQGRHAGLSLWGAGQFLSAVDEQVRGNAMTRALGRTLPDELSSGAYGRLPTGLSELIVNLPKGQMVLWHSTYRSALSVRFPRPAWRTGTSRTSGASGHPGGSRPARKSARDVLDMPARRVEKLTEGIPEAVVESVVARADDPVRAAAELEKLRVPDMRKDGLAMPPVAIDPDNPWGLD